MRLGARFAFGGPSMDRLHDAAATLPARLLFGRFELQPFERRLLVDGIEATLGGRAFDVLLILAEHMGLLVSRNELIDRVWSGLVVEENNLSVQVHALRRVLGTDVVVTVPGRGYRLVTSVDAVMPLGASLHEPSSPRTGLPESGTPLVGRETELAALAALMKQHRLVTVIGAGGIGKTRLAHALMRRGIGTYRHGVCWVDLGPVRDTAALPSIVAAALDLQSSTGDSIAALARITAGLEVLIALDNAEHLVDGVAPMVQTLLDQAPKLRFLVTSQVPMRLASERVLHLGPLAWPGDDVAPSQAMAFGAVALFAGRARAADSRFMLTEAQMPLVVELCRRLDGLPLAIELAAARAPALGLQPLRDALSGRLQLLTANRNRQAPSRQQTLRAALEWSHGLLDERAQRVFLRMAVIAGSASVTFVRNFVCDENAADGLDEWGVLDALDQLVQRSLVEAVGDEPDGAPPLEPRYRLLESPRAFAQERMVASGEEQMLRQRHARAMRAEFERTEQAMRAGARGFDDWSRDGDRDLADARQAIDWATSMGDAELVIALLTALLLRAPPALGSEEQRLALRCRELLEQSSGVDPRVAQRGWLIVSNTVGATQRQVSCAAAMRSLGLARQLHGPDGDPYVLYRALCEAAWNAAWTKQPAQADALMREALELEDPRWPPWCLSFAPQAAALIATQKGEPAAALALYRRALELCRMAGKASVNTQANVCNMELMTGDAAAAAKTGRSLVATLAGRRSEDELAVARVNLAAAYLALKATGDAREQLLAVMPLASQLRRDAPYCHLAWVDYVVLLAALEGRCEDAAELLGASDGFYRDASAVREPNEAAACDHACALALEALGATAFEALRARGRAQADLVVANLAFGDMACAQGPPGLELR
jgi:predicted ATPase/DNA-binding winged helix-turn-helix (wHTH) protein